MVGTNQSLQETSALPKRIAMFAATVLLAIGLFALVACTSSSGSSASGSSTASSESASASSASSTSSSSSSAAPQQIQVPNLIGLERESAVKQLRNAGFSTWEVQLDYSDTVPKGNVISQNPAALTTVSSDTVVKLVVSQGKKAAADVTMPNLIGMTQSDAEKALSAAHLVAIPGNPIVSTDVAPGLVCKQSIKAGTTVKEGTQVTFNTALAQETVEVPNVVGMNASDATAALQNANLGVDTTSVYSDTVAEDNVISQSVAANTKVVKGTVVKIQISLGPKPVEKVIVPDIMTFNLTDAIDALASAGLNYRYSGEEQGNVVAMDPEAGTEVDKGSTVTFTLKRQSMLVEVPDVAGMAGYDARAAMDAAGLVLDYDVRHPERVLSGTEPAAGTMVDPGTYVSAVYPDPIPGGDGGGTNPWTDANSAEEAASLAGLSSFSVMDDITVGDKSFSNPAFSYTEDIAQAVYSDGDIEIVVRKGQNVSGTDLSGDYNTYPEYWGINFKGLMIACWGNEDGEASLAIFTYGGCAYSIDCSGITLSSDDVTSIVAGVQ